MLLQPSPDYPVCPQVRFGQRGLVALVPSLAAVALNSHDLDASRLGYVANGPQLGVTQGHRDVSLGRQSDVLNRTIA